MSRLILVSNRLPVTVSVSPEGVHVSQSSGGLATGVSGPHRTSKGVWIGWTGHTGVLSEEHRAQVDAQLAERRLVGVHLSATDVEEFYDGYCNRVLWPLFHYQLERLPLHCEDWPAYARVNTALADIVCSHYQPGDTIWVHDYQLMLLPRLLRERLPSARIGFFLHIPFPAAEVFRILPNREELLEGLLGADLIGFHTLSYARHFANSLTAVLGLTADRRGFSEAATREVERARRSPAPLTVVYIDCDNFKAVNDSAGHSVGNALLRTVGKVLRENSRGADVPARLGGDEFALLLVGAGLKEGEECLARLQSELRAAMSAREWPVTFSIGAVCVPIISESTSVDELLRQADRLMYQAKELGKNRIVHQLHEQQPPSLSS